MNDITRRNLFKQELLFRWVLIIGTIFLIQTGERFVGGAINYAYAYTIAGFYAFFNLFCIVRPELGSYQGKARSLLAFVDMTSILLMIAATGGVSSQFYLILGILPLIAGVYFGIMGSVMSGILSILAITLMAVLDQGPHPDLSSLLAVRYAFLIVYTILDTYISAIILSDRKRLTILYNISQSGSSGPALTNVVESIDNVAAEYFKAEKVLIYIYEEGSAELKLQLPALGVPEDQVDIFEDAATSLDSLGPVTDSSEILSLSGEGDNRDVGSAVFPPFRNMRNCLIAPLLARGKKIGFIVLCDRYGSKHFRKSEVKLLELVSSHISVYIENAVLYRSSEEHVAQLTSLIRVVDAIGSVASIDHIYNLALDVVRGLFAVDMALINIINHDTGLLEPVRSFGFSDEYTKKNIAHPFERIESCFVLTNDRSYMSEDIFKDQRCPNLRVDKSVRSVLCVPIKSGNNVYGLLHLASCYTSAFNQNDITLANAIGEQIGMAVERARLFDEINRLAITDALTGLYNRRYLANILEEEVRRSARYSHSLSFIMIDIDHFKFYNDRNGHPMGDEVLRTLAQILRESVRDVDTVFRYGGEEFSVLAPELDKEDVSFLAERLRKVVREHRFPFEEDQPEGDLTISIGVASFPADASDGYELIQKSDQALYLAKREGRDRVSLYMP